MSKSIGLVDETASPVPPHGEIGGPDDPTGYNLVEQLTGR